MQFNIFTLVFAILAASQVQAALSAQGISTSIGKVTDLVDDATKTAEAIGGSSYRGAVPRLVINTRNIIGLLTGEFTKIQQKFLNTIASKGGILTGGPAASVIDNILHALKRGVEDVSAGVIAGVPSCVTAKDNKRTLDEALDKAMVSML
ncbi:hypothetical protein G7Z17_g6165 [Cylindrodendrum hubeiense]|uniref:Uncharacterized protein n=1 Tax=Cylindrodendrum hubeiense TaxID=595255 RepID=A0A9P5L8H2_9HYPO|nr:hypothetical protein G7Z17_g6165 [Cylindrodendrum hubeiense]